MEYMRRAEGDDLEALLDLFTDDATVTSPIFGDKPVREFYSYVFSEISDRAMDVQAVFVGATDPRKAAVHASYTRAVGDNPPATINVVDVFELNAELTRFTSVTLIYDTAPVRTDFE